jgi:hypothetical protein
VPDDLDVTRAQKRAEFAIDYAIASVDQARLATLDAIVGCI